ncbi:MAG TPA: pyridoxal phosphate-dependent aminotransferase [Polyangia bacterium]|nr:pyridoxal phosphate-dependent aminotransferase [Polyangia bacterium]
MRSARLDWEPAENALAAVTRAAAARGTLLDLTETNPTRVGLPYPQAALAAALARAPFAAYEPAPLGLPAARAAVAADYARAGVTVDPARVVLTASSSESYGFLFKLCCDPGDAVLVPEPSYPLFEYLTRLEGAAPIGYRLAFDGVWHVDFGSLDDALAAARRAGRRTRAIVVVNPNNPTGSFLKREELGRLAALAAREALALVSDEVFAPYPFGPDRARIVTAAVDAAAAEAPAVFSLGGLSKACGLPQLKLGWIVAGGREAARSLAALELIADSYLSVATPVQAALPDLLALGAEVREAIAARVAGNRAALAAALPAAAGCTLLPAEGGWSAIVRLPASRSDEAWAAGLATEAGVLVQPGYFFDLAGGTFLVVSLLPAPEVFAAALARLVAHVAEVLR